MKSFILRACLAALLCTGVQAASAQNILSILAAVTDLSCHSANGTSDGSIDVQVEGGTVPYTYEWTGSGGFFSTTEDQFGLEAGTYSLTVTDADGQTQEAEYTLSAPSQLVISESLHNPDCNLVNGSASGTIDITASGGIAPYTYHWTGSGLDATSEDQWSLGTGTYCITITDAYGCNAAKCFDLTEPEVLQISADISTSTCIDSEGAINIVVIGGTLPYTYEWSNGMIGNTVSNLEQGTYSVTVTDNNGCTEQGTYEILGGESFSTAYSQTNFDCTNQTVDYEITVTGSNGPYTLSYSTSTGGTIENLDSNLGADGGIAIASNILVGHTYAIVITDQEGCFQEEILDITSANGANLEAPHLCIVTTNDSGHNEILWEDGEGPTPVAEHNIYREENTSGNFEKIGSVEEALDNRYIDTEAEQTTRPYRYYVSASDNCGNESPTSDIHKTIHLQIGQGVGGNINLQWDEYEGITYDNVVVLRGSSPTDLVEYVTLPANVFTFTDDNPPAGDVFYQLVIGLSVDCTIARSLFQLKSNIVALVETSTEDVDWIQSIYPNPVSETLNLELEQAAQLVIININGKAIQLHNLKAGSNQINTERLSAGMYLLQLMQGEEVFVTRLVKE